MPPLGKRVSSASTTHALSKRASHDYPIQVNEGNKGNNGNNGTNLVDGSGSDECKEENVTIKIGEKTVKEIVKKVGEEQKGIVKSFVRNYTIQLVIKKEVMGKYNDATKTISTVNAVFESFFPHIIHGKYKFIAEVTSPPSFSPLSGLRKVILDAINAINCVEHAQANFIASFVVDKFLEQVNRFVQLHSYQEGGTGLVKFKKKIYKTSRTKRGALVIRVGNEKTIYYVNGSGKEVRIRKS
jgi:hypothetical protein